MAKNSKYAYLLGTTHFTNVKYSKKLAEAIKDSTDCLKEGTRFTIYDINFKNLIREPFYVIGLTIYALVFGAMVFIGRQYDTKSFKALVSKINPKIKYSNVDAGTADLVKFAHKKYSYLIQLFAIIVLVLSFIIAGWSIFLFLIFLFSVLNFMKVTFDSIDYRDKLAAEGTIKLSREGKTVIILYGLRHRAGIKKYIERKGIKVILIRRKITK